MSAPPTNARPHPLRWLVTDWQWPYAGAFAACFLLALFPVLWSTEGLAIALVYLQLPVYMVHQLEEHGDDRFRRYVNERLGSGREVLTPMLTFGINLVAVWALILAAFLLAYYVEPGLGLIAVYLTGVNALVHLVGALVARAYNPGLLTALALFVPLTVWSAIEISSSYEIGAGLQTLVLAIAVGGHLAIIAIVAARIRLVV